MKRNTALFGASAAVGLTAAAGLIMTSATSSAASPAPTLYGIAYSTTTTSAGFAFGAIANPDFVFTGSSAKVGDTSVASVTVIGSPRAATVTTKCQDGKPAAVVNGKTYTSKTVITAASFTGNANAIGNVTVLASAGSVTVGAYYDLTPAGQGSYIEVGGVSGCTAATSTSTGPTSTSTGPTSTSTGPTSTSTGPTGTSTGPTGTSTGPTGTSTGPSSTTSTSSSPTSTATQPPTPTATTTTLPVTG